MSVGRLEATRSSERDIKAISCKALALIEVESGCLDALFAAQPILILNPGWENNKPKISPLKKEWMGGQHNSDFSFFLSGKVA